MGVKEILYFNGRFLGEEEAKISVQEPGFLLGWGLFETLRSYYGRIVYLAAHLQRLRSSAKLLGLGLRFSDNKIKAIIRELIRLNKLKDAYVRITLWKQEKGTRILVTAKKYQPYPKAKYKKGLKIMISPFRQSNPFLAGLKTTNRVLYEIAFNQAKKQGFEGALLLNNRGYLCEATRSNIFLVKGKELFTPALECGCLDGITRRIILDLAKKHKIKAYTGNFTVQDLFASDEAFLTNSLAGIMPLFGKCGRITKFFQEKYRSLLK